MKHPKKSSTYDLVLIGSFVGLLSICSWISIPFIIPFTLQTMGLFTAIGLLGGKRGTLCILIYLLLGGAGMPVFSGFTGGVGSLFGPSGGFLLGFLCYALLMWGMELVFGRGEIALLCSMTAGLMLCYLVGTLWYVAVYAKDSAPIGWWTALSRCVFPFLVPDTIKLCISLSLIRQLRSIQSVSFCIK